MDQPHHLCVILPQPQAFSKGQGMEKLGQWLEERCHREHLSLRQAGARAGLSHVTISHIMNGGRPLPETIRRLARGFGGVGYQGLVLEDKLLTLAGHRTERPEGEITEPMAELMDRASNFSEPQLKMVTKFAEFLTEMERMVW